MRSTARALRSLVIAAAFAVTCGACGGGPAAPSVNADFASQFDSLWNTFDREYSYFDYKRIDWDALKTTYRPRAIAASEQSMFIAVIRELLAQLHDQHVVVRDPGGSTLPTYLPDAFVNWDRTV